MYGTLRSPFPICNILRCYTSVSSFKPAVSSTFSRLYTSKGSENVSKTPHTIKPDDMSRSSAVKPTGVHTSVGRDNRFTSEQECRKPNSMKDMPQPNIRWEDRSRHRNYGRHLALGVILTAISIFAFYNFGLHTTRKQEHKEKKTKDVKKRRKPKIALKEPASSRDIPEKIKYLLIGGGTASFSAFRSIKVLDPTAQVLVVSNESHFPYMRPPLSKEMWFNEEPHSKPLTFKQWNGTERSLFYEPDEFYVDCMSLKAQPHGGVAVARGWSVKKIDVFERKAYLEDGYAIEYDECLIATGSSPKNLPVFKEASESIQDRVSLYRDIFDYQELEEILKEGVKNIVIIGGGFLGSELACALARRGRNHEYQITQIFRESGNMGRVLPEYLSFWTSHKVQNEGVKVIANSEVEDVSLEKNGVVLHLSTGEKIPADHVIVAVGVEPNTDLAEASQLEIDEEYGGYLVNAELMARSHLWVAGDCTCFYDTKLGRRRVEHHDHAVVSGRLAGQNMTGAGKPYVHQSMFWSDLGPEVGYEAIGIVDSALPTVGVFAEATEKDTPKAVVTETDQGDRAETEAQATPVKPATSSPSPPQEGEDYGKGVIFYLKDDVVVGIVLWNVFNRMSVARQVLRDGRRYEDLNEVAKLFHIHEDQP